MDPTTGSCVDVDECSIGRDDCNMMSTTCLDNHGSFACICRTGFYNPLDTPNSCQDLDECEYSKSIGFSICPTYGRCYNTLGSYVCICLTGFDPVYINGQLSVCNDINECHTPITGSFPSVELSGAKVDVDQSSFNSASTGASLALDGLPNTVAETASEIKSRMRFDMRVHRPVRMVRMNGVSSSDLFRVFLGRSIDRSLAFFCGEKPVAGPIHEAIFHCAMVARYIWIERPDYHSAVRIAHVVIWYFEPYTGPIRCGANSGCINTIGGSYCDECSDGYILSSSGQCVDANECATSCSVAAFPVQTIQISSSAVDFDPMPSYYNFQGNYCNSKSQWH